MNERIATPGNWLTQANIDDEQGRTFAQRVAGYGDLAALFVEWSDEQKARWEEDHPQEEHPEELLNTE